MIRRPPRSTLSSSSAASDVYKRQVRQKLIVNGSDASTDALHDRLLQCVDSAPFVTFSESTVATLSQMFSSAIQMYDTRFQSTSEYLLYSMFWFLVSTAVVSIYVPWYLIIVALIYLAIFGTFKQLPQVYPQLPGIIAAAEAKAQDQYSDGCSGLPVIRAFEQSEAFVGQYDHLCDQATTWNHKQLAISCWLELRASLIGSIGYCGLATMIVFMIEHMSAGTAGLLLVNAAFLSFLCMMLLENGIHMYELAYHRAECAKFVEAHGSEPKMEDSPLDQGAGEIPEAWPTTGRLEVFDLSMRYADHLPLTLDGVSFVLQPGERAACVGRTGAGKSSLMVGITRLVEPCGGRVLVDGIDISQMSTHLFRSRLGVMSQDCLFFTGTLRYNLSPFGQHTDEALKLALREVGLDLSLDLHISGQGTNLSMGQRHLCQLTRLLLARPRLLLLDEPTAHLDPETGRAVLGTVFRILPKASVLHVAHDISATVGYDRIIVMDKGKVLENGAPWELLQDPAGALSKIVDSQGRSASQTIRQLAQNAVEAKASDKDSQSINPSSEKDSQSINPSLDTDSQV
eukprot:TRINITY_DN7000_c0_g1_i7.p1 TRINITY_DN7000_c0_g1~~TRINITY_DN7000_c0_g1_i7.p1  ORF type:complete len:570 (+),score=101.18 TRINITY_DN7000_c0_g1_i7:125-1834(+)